MPLVVAGEVRDELACTCQHARWRGKCAAERLAVLDVSKKLHQAAHSSNRHDHPARDNTPDFEQLDSGRHTALSADLETVEKNVANARCSETSGNGQNTKYPMNVLDAC